MRVSAICAASSSGSVPTCTSPSRRTTPARGRWRRSAASRRIRRPGSTWRGCCASTVCRSSGARCRGAGSTRSSSPTARSSTPTSRSDSSARSHEEDSPAVLRIALLGLLRADRVLRPKAHDRDAVGRDATRDQVVAGRARPALAEGDVVLGRAPRVAVPLEQDEHLWVRLEPLDVRLEDLRVVGPEVVLVEVEVDRLHLGDLCELLRLGSARLGRRGGDGLRRLRRLGSGGGRARGRGGGGGGEPAGGGGGGGGGPRPAAPPPGAAQPRGGGPA